MKESLTDWLTISANIKSIWEPPLFYEVGKNVTKKKKLRLKKNTECNFSKKFPNPSLTFLAVSKLLNVQTYVFCL